MADTMRLHSQSPWAEDLAAALRRRQYSPRTQDSYLRNIEHFEAWLAEQGILATPESAGSNGRHADDGDPVRHADGHAGRQAVTMAEQEQSDVEPTISLKGWTMDTSRWRFQLLVDYLDHLLDRDADLSPRTISLKFTAIGHYAKHLHRHHGFPLLDLERFWEEELVGVTKQVKKERAKRKNTPPTIQELRMVVRMAGKPRNRAFLLLAAKTGARRSELLAIDWEDIDLEAGEVHFKDDGRHHKRTNHLGLIDAETVMALKVWRSYWENVRAPGEMAVFVGSTGRHAGERLGRTGCYRMVKEAFERVGIEGKNVHSLRHWFSDTLRAEGMPDHMIRYLRGDAPVSALDLYTHLQSEEGRRRLREAYDGAVVRLT